MLLLLLPPLLFHRQHIQQQQQHDDEKLKPRPHIPSRRPLPLSLTLRAVPKRQKPRATRMAVQAGMKMQVRWQ